IGVGVNLRRPRSGDHAVLAINTGDDDRLAARAADLDDGIIDRAFGIFDHTREVESLRQSKILLGSATILRRSDGDGDVRVAIDDRGHPGRPTWLAGDA